MNMERKEQYKKEIARKYTELENPEAYLEKIVEINGENIHWIDTNSDVYLWALFGKKASKDEAVCLQVGASIEGREEIKQDIEKMQDSNYSVTDANDMTAVNTQFYTDVYYIPCDKDKRVEKTRYQYRKIKEDYAELMFYKIDIDKYLAVDDMKIENEHVREIFNLSKAYYAETKFAFDTQAIYWNAYRSGVGMDTLKQLISKE
jgi:dephospho-CoA kinase